MLGLSNILLSRQALDYFGSATEYNPFLQTWSLGIEQQFYLIMPISLILIFKWTKYRRASLLNAFVLWLALGIASLSIFLRSDIFSSQYYALSARGWELAAGVLLSVFIALRGGAGIFSPPLPDRLFDILVLPILVLSVFFKSKLSIVLVVVLTLFLLAEKPKSYILSNGVMVKIGLASYSIYLWHWPVIWLTRWLGFSTEKFLVSSLLLLAVLLLGFQSYKKVELPFLDNKDSVLKPRYFFIFLPVGLFSLGISSSLGFLPSVYLGSEKFANVDEIVWGLHDYNKYVSLKRPRVALLGNSHARHILPPLLKNANISNVSLKYREIDTGAISLSNERREANRVLLDKS